MKAEIALSTVVLAAGTFLAVQPLAHESSTATEVDRSTEIVGRVGVYSSRLELADLTLRSDEVISAVVVDSRAVLQGDIPCHEYELSVVHRLFGADEETVLVRVPGGSGPATTLQVEGAPELTIGDELVLFLRRIPGHDAYALNALGEGCYRVRGLGDVDSGGVFGRHALPGERVIEFLGRVADLRSARATQGGATR